MRISVDHIFWIVLATLIGAAAFFTSGVVGFKRSMTGADIQFASGQKVAVTRIIDGDDLAVRLGDHQLRIRILGIATFDPNLNDPLVRGAAGATTAYLSRTLLNNEVELVYDSSARDKNGRVLAYIHRNALDIGEDMVANGLALTFTRYPFSRMKRYLAAERLARDERTGLWGDPALARRARDLQKVWERQ